MLSQSGYFILATMMEITRMNQTCPHCQALVILPELVRNYGDMPIQCHDCENSFFLPAEQLSKTMGGVERRRCRSCKLALYLPELHITLASTPLAARARLARHYSGHWHRAFYRRGRISIRTSLFDYAQSGIGADSNNGDRYF